MIMNSIKQGLWDDILRSSEDKHVRIVNISLSETTHYVRNYDRRQLKENNDKDNHKTYYIYLIIKFELIAIA